MSDYQVPAVVSAIRLLSILAQADGQPISQTELARRAELSKSSAHNLLTTLESAQFVQRDVESRRYRLGPALIPLGSAASRQTRIVAIAVDRAAALAAELGLSIALVQPTREGDTQVIESFYPPQDMHVGIRVGSRYGPFDGAVGKCLMAAMDEDELSRLLAEEKVPARTPATITNPRKLLGEVATVREQGWAASVQEYNENNAVVAPITGASGQHELLVLAVGFLSQLPDDSVPEVGRRLRRVADEVSDDALGRTTLSEAAV
jgi:IclR family transcriptional regulator, acetate operon repressor